MTLNQYKHMAKSRNFSVYLLKEGFDARNSLKEDHSLVLLEEADTSIPAGGMMYLFFVIISFCYRD